VSASHLPEHEIDSTRRAFGWTEMETEIDSYDPAARAEAAASQAGDEVVVGPRSVTVLRATSRLR